MCAQGAVPGARRVYTQRDKHLNDVIGVTLHFAELHRKAARRCQVLVSLCTMTSAQRGEPWHESACQAMDSVHQAQHNKAR